MNLMTTQDVVDALGVSRQWVNRYLRDMGRVVMHHDGTRTAKRVVMYDAAEILAWINAAAECSRQTVRLPADQFGRISNEEARRYIDLVDTLAASHDDAELERAAALLDELYRTALPPALYERLQEIGGSPRRRGTTPWAPMDYQIGSLEELYTIDQMMERYGYRNNELAYRDIYVAGWIRVAVAGRRWYVRAPEQYDGYQRALIRVPFALLTGD